MMHQAAVIIEMDQERDRKTCIHLDLKVTGANRELAQWLLDHPRYPATDIANWLGCGATRIKDLRIWAGKGFAEDAHPTRARSRRDDRRRADDASLETNDNSELDDDPGEGDATDEVAAPDEIENNGLYVIQRINANAKASNKILKASAIDREAAERISTAIERMIDKWRSIQSTLARKG